MYQLQRVNMFSQEDERYDKKQQKILAEVPPPPQMPTLTVPAMGSVHLDHPLLHFEEYLIQEHSNLRNF